MNLTPNSVASYWDELEKIAYFRKGLVMGAGAGAAAGYATSEEKSKKRKLLAALKGAGLGAAGGVATAGGLLGAGAALGAAVSRAVKLPKANRILNKAIAQKSSSRYSASSERAYNKLFEAERRYWRVMELAEPGKVLALFSGAPAAGAYLGVKFGKRKKGKK